MAPSKSSTTKAIFTALRQLENAHAMISNPPEGCDDHQAFEEEVGHEFAGLFCLFGRLKQFQTSGTV